ncbi:glycerophosphodiester phosphodiesterase family protein [Halobacteriovorax sp. HLS]|uniref:glycerophosphodiester phosphodiesterase n=1 Tax=Halobacteriovorax sp. HLS TaxID=2234000 RepID=UPI000FD8D3D2|nr:glycerophosphodiester phosphodiesterase family protein [Halobacteriovorax sp. HLS]
MRADTVILGHRGAKGERPENTILGIRYALELGVKAIEIDIHLSKDNRLVVIHDDTVDRTTNSQGVVKEMSSSELRELDAGMGEKIPFLEEVLELLNEFSFTLFIEVKSLGCEKLLVELISSSEIDLYSKVIVKSFNHRIVKKIKELDPKIRTACLIYGLPINAVNIIEDARADGISISTSTVDQALVDLCKHNNYKVTVWNVNELSELAHFVEMGVDFIGTDFPSSVNLD